MGTFIALRGAAKGLFNANLDYAGGMFGTSSSPCSRCKGRNTENSVPLFPARVRLECWIVPSCFSIRPRLTQRPNPVPFSPLLVVKKGAKRFFCGLRSECQRRRRRR